ncbi:MAG: hypothetical protein QOJ76_1258, partial [Acidobacteriota bacterium]|nr:hypothetical protein [Acidobacteriota bacterium]
MRKSLLTALLGVALVVTPAAFPTKSDAARALRQIRTIVPLAKPRPTPLPNYDIRLVGRGEFNDSALNSTAVTRSAVKNGTPALQARASAVEDFRAGLNAQAARNLRAEVNESGAMKNFFIEGAPLSSPRADLPDNIARNFLGSRASMFALTGAGVAALKLDKEDDDAGTSFLNYTQTIGGIKVFEGDVRVAVNADGQVLSVREGFLVNGQKVGLRPALNETEGIAKAFEHAGRSVIPSFAETRARESKGDSASFANPIESRLEDVLSELNVVRVGDAARLAWHVYADV